MGKVKNPTELERLAKTEQWFCIIESFNGINMVINYEMRYWIIVHQQHLVRGSDCLVQRQRNAAVVQQNIMPQSITRSQTAGRTRGASVPIPD